MKKYTKIICMVAAVCLLGAAAFCGFRIYSHYAHESEQEEVLKPSAGETPASRDSESGKNPIPENAESDQKKGSEKAGSEKKHTADKSEAGKKQLGIQETGADDLSLFQILIKTVAVEAVHIAPIGLGHAVHGVIAGQQLDAIQHLFGQIGAPIHKNSKRHGNDPPAVARPAAASGAKSVETGKHLILRIILSHFVHRVN